MYSLRDIVAIPSIRQQAMDIVKGICPDNPNIVEIGSSRRFTQEAVQMEGLISLHLLDLCDEKQGEYWSVDIDPITAFALDKIFVGHAAHAICQNGEEWSKSFENPIDVLVLDSMDVGLEGYKEHHRNLYLNLRERLQKDSILVLDDVYPIDGLGKGELVLPLAIEDGFKYLMQGYVVVMRRD